MGLTVNNNIAAMNSYRNLSVTDGQMSKSLEKLSSGFRINRAADDAAGLAISEGLRSQIGGLKVAVRNTQDGISVVQTAEGALTETQSILQRMRDLSVQAANGSNDSNSLNALNAESEALKSELNRIASKTTFNNVALLDGAYAKDFQVGYASGDTLNVKIVAKGAAASFTTTAAGNAVTTTAGTFTIAQSGGPSITTGALAAQTSASGLMNALNADSNFKTAFNASLAPTGELKITALSGSANAVTVALGTATASTGFTTGTGAAAGADGGFSSTGLNVAGVNLTSAAGAAAAITSLDGAIKAVSESRANLGALQNRFEHTINNLNVTAENLTASESRIRDTDMAQEMTNFTRTQILTQAGTAMLAQANQVPQGILKLLG
ncbi:MAG: fliC [Blastococcus sp.]|jgi:flagellin|nr:fliC [Blastococcus sp.]